MAKLGPDERAGYQALGVVEGYDRWAATYDQDPNPLIALEEGVALELIGDVRGQRILDLGCGTGRYCALLARQGAEVVGVDPSTEMLNRARYKIGTDCRFELRQGTIEQLAFPDEGFDLVLSALTLGHLPELEPTLGEATRVIKKGGHMLISDIHPYWPVSGHRYTEFFDQAGQEYRIPSYPHLFEEYWALSKKLGLRVQDVREPRIDGPLIVRFPSLEDYALRAAGAAQVAPPRGAETDPGTRGRPGTDRAQDHNLCRDRARARPAQRKPGADPSGRRPQHVTGPGDGHPCRRKDERL